MSKLTHDKYHIFIGPSSFGLNINLPMRNNIVTYPPVKRSDLINLIHSYSPSKLVIVDGSFHESLAVGHMEIRTAINNGWIIHGLSSMGAIRACEMSHLGMIGYGRVYKFFSLYEDFSDDEVALLHTEDHPYFHISEPLINLRYYLKFLKSSKVISAKTHLDVLRELKKSYFGDRTIEFCNHLLTSSEPNCLNGLDLDFNNFRVKNKDFQSFIKHISIST